MKLLPPKRALQFLRWFCREDYLDEIEGDLIEIFKKQYESSPRKAKWKFGWSVIKYFRPEFMKSFKNYYQPNSYDMLQNYFKVGLRNILKYKMFSFINIFGLAVAMSVCMLIILMLADQNRYDQFHEKNDRIYRILSIQKKYRQPYASSAYPLASALMAEYPIIEETTNLTPGVGGDVTYQQKLADMRGYFADPSFFNVFSFELVNGDKSTALTNPNSMVISSKLANQLFYDENPIGKIVEFSDRQLPFPQEFDGQGESPVLWGSFTITGVIDESKYKSHLKFDVLVSSSSRKTLYVEKKIEDMTNNWEWFYRSYTYVLLNKDNGREDLVNALDDLVAHKYGNLTSEQIKGFKLMPQKLSEIQLGLMSNDTNNRLPLLGYYFLAGLAIVIMISACLNYTNLSIARALTRAKEIGIRKVAGAHRKNLIFQFLSESVITAMFSLGLAILLLLFIVPAFKGLWVNRYLNFELPAMMSTYLIFIGFALFIGILAGVYPALYLSKYQPIKALKNVDNGSPGRLSMRKALGVSQFVISLFFITTSILIYNQFKHFLSFDYGFQTDNIVNIELQGIEYQKLSNEFLSVPGVSSISACDIIPAGGTSNSNEFKKAGDGDDYKRVGILLSDEKFITNLGIELIAGQNLPAAGESSNSFVLINEAMVRDWGYQFPSETIGQLFESKRGNETLEVIGVVKDFRYILLINEDKIAPLVLRNNPAEFKYLNVQISSNNIKDVMAELENKWKKIDPIHPFKYEFFDQQLQSTHQAIFDLVSILGFIAFLAIVIACLGLLGMAIYTAERKTKEIGIRKILGAAEVSIAILLSKGFLRMLLVSILIGAPLSYFVNNLWLQRFPNRVEFGFGTVIIGTLILLVLGFMTIGSQTIKASRSNPVNSLKSE